MNTMQQAPPAGPGAIPDAQDMSAAVEEQMGKIVTELGAALGCCSPRSGPGADCGPRWPGPGR
jgi:hypothetical protein